MKASSALLCGLLTVLLTPFLQIRVDGFRSVVTVPSRSHKVVVRPLFLGPDDVNENKLITSKSIHNSKEDTNNQQNIIFSGYMVAAGAALGPFLDSFHSAFGVLEYDAPLTATLWGSPEHPALITTWWVPELFGLAGFLIGWLYIFSDSVLLRDNDARCPSPPKILVGISFFTFQYYLSGLLYTLKLDRTTILNVMSVLAAVGFAMLDGTMSGLAVSAATALGGPLIEVGLLSLAKTSMMMGSGYHYTDPGEIGFFPLWIAPVYFLGGPAVGNLARGIYQALSSDRATGTARKEAPCPACSDTRCVPCPNCNGVGTYVAMGRHQVTCTSCRGRGFVLCRACFDRYDEDPADINAIRELMRRMPD